MFESLHCLQENLINRWNAPKDFFDPFGWKMHGGAVYGSVLSHEQRPLSEIAAWVKKDLPFGWREDVGIYGTKTWTDGRFSVTLSDDGHNGTDIQWTRVTKPVHRESQQSIARESKEKVLWGVKKGDPAWKEQILSTSSGNFERVKKLAAKQGFHNFRIAIIDTSTPPNFKGAVKKENTNETALSWVHDRQQKEPCVIFMYHIPTHTFLTTDGKYPHSHYWLGHKVSRDPAQAADDSFRGWWFPHSAEFFYYGVWNNRQQDYDEPKEWMFREVLSRLKIKPKSYSMVSG